MCVGAAGERAVPTPQSHVQTIADGELALIMGEASGHGPEAAALGARLCTVWQAFCWRVPTGAPC
jgi:hypothetical protein